MDEKAHVPYRAKVRWDKSYGQYQAYCVDPPNPKGHPGGWACAWGETPEGALRQMEASIRSYLNAEPVRTTVIYGTRRYPITAP